jgi:hypothetical protein
MNAITSFIKRYPNILQKSKDLTHCCAHKTNVAG